MIYLVVFYWGACHLNRSQPIYLSLYRWSLSFNLVFHWIFSMNELRSSFMEESLGLGGSGLLMSSVLALIAWIFSFRKKFFLWSVTVLPFVSLLLISLHFSVREGVIDLPSSWLWTHIMLMILGEIFIFLCALAAGLYLFTSHVIKRKRSPRILLRLPSLVRQQEFLFRILVLGFCFLSFGLMLGFFFAGKLWEGQWWLSSTVILALASWVLYLSLILFHIFCPRHRGGRFSVLVIVVFLLIFGVYFVYDMKTEEPHYLWGSSEEAREP